MFKKWGWLLVIGVVLGATAATLRWWWPLLLGFMNVQSATLQGLANLSQILLALGSIASGLFAWRRRKNEPPASVQENESYAQPKQTPETRKAEANHGGVVFTDQARGNITITGDVIVPDARYFEQVFGRGEAPPDLQQATRRYLEYLVEKYQYLEFKGMGVSDRVPLQLRLQDLYVPLKARVELPRGETWSRDVRAAGRKIPEGDREALGQRLSDPTSLQELLQQRNGLIILGDPGAGKTTFLKYLTLQLALGETPQPRLPVLVPLSAYANALAERPAIRLDEFICNYFHHLGVDLPMPELLRQALQQGSAVVMLDGLDEVKDLTQRDTVVRKVVDFYTFHKKTGNKFLLTSRIIGYREVRPTGTDIAECTLDDFDDEAIREFVERWTVAIEKAARGGSEVAQQEAQRERDELLQAVQMNPGVQRLAANPLLLTILALMKRQGVRLPDRRVELYDKYVETLLSTWNRARGLDRPTARELDVVETVRLLAPLALWMHEVNPGAGLVKKRELQKKLESLYAERGEADAAAAAHRFLDDVREYSGLLLERGAGEYGFIHLTFEEYLAAVAIAQRGQQSIDPIVDVLAAHVGDANWHEVSLLAIAYLGIVQQRDEAASAVVQQLIRRAPGAPGQAVTLAGEAVADAWPGGVPPACRKQVIEALLHTMTDSDVVKPVQRAAAGNALARLGDPRFRADAWFLPADPADAGLGFVEIPAGPFLMGSDKERDSGAFSEEEPQHELTLPTYYINRYPVTVAQFRAFVEATGYKPENPNCLRAVANHPVVRVSLHEALKYCDWLTETLRLWEGTPEPLARLLREENWRFTLPSEAEWEKAARGTDGRTYPWGNEADPNKANYDDTGIGAISPVGCFPAGASPYSCQDMTGNVREWTRSLWGRKWDEPFWLYPYDPADGRENLQASGRVRRVVRGGAFNYDLRYARCAYRDEGYPSYRSYRLGFRVVLRLSL